MKLKSLPKIFTLIAIVFILASCTNSEDSKTISFIRYYPNILWDSIGNSYLFIEQYAEYKFSQKDSLYFGISESCERAANDYSQFGLSKFYSMKVDKEFSDLMEILSNGNYKESYIRPLGVPHADDRHANNFVIYENGIKKIVSYCEVERLPFELRKADSLINEFVKSVRVMSDKPNYSVEIISSLQDSLFHRHPPPPPPMNFMLPQISE